MKHAGTQRLETKRLVLRRFVREDAAAMYQNWAADPEVTRYLTWQPHSSLEESQRIVNEWIETYGKEDSARYFQWAIVWKETGEPIGNISVVRMDEDVSMAQIGYCIGKAWWHQGITSEALKAVLDFLFDVVEVNRVEARHDPQNPHSGQVMQKCGMKYEGTLRSSDRNNQGLCDACYYALLKSER